MAKLKLKSRRGPRIGKRASPAAVAQLGEGFPWGVGGSAQDAERAVERTDAIVAAASGGTWPYEGGIAGVDAAAAQAEKTVAATDVTVAAEIDRGIGIDPVRGA